MNVRIVSDEVPATQAEIAAFERRIDAVLPADYRTFLASHNGGGPECDDQRFEYATFPVHWQGRIWADTHSQVMLDAFYSLSENSPLPWRGAEEAFVRFHRIPADLIPIGQDSGGGQILLGITGERKGGVFYWAKNFEPIEDYKMPTYDNIGFVANSFTEFLGLLRPYVEDGT